MDSAKCQRIIELTNAYGYDRTCCMHVHDMENTKTVYYLTLFIYYSDTAGFVLGFTKTLAVGDHSGGVLALKKYMCVCHRY